MNYKIIILGAGIGGLGVGSWCSIRGDDFIIVDLLKSIPLNFHNGIHYLHSQNLDLPFEFKTKKIQATEEIWNPRTDEFKKMSVLPEMIEYSMKLMGIRHPSSIMDPGNREWDTFVPESNNMNDLIKSMTTELNDEITEK